MEDTRFTLKDLGLIATSLIITFAGVTATACKDKYPHDNKIEEFAETVAENIIEDKLGLPDGSLDDKVDFTFWSDEDGKKE